MITCRFIGKLGNHMYQTAATIKVAEDLNTDFVLPTKSHAGHHGDITPDFSGFSYPFKFEDIKTQNIFDQKVFHYVPIESSDNMELNGFYQSYKYFDDIKDKLINKYFKFSDEIIKKASKFNIPENSLAISVRRGDYLWLQHNHCVLSTKYYQEAVNKLIQDTQIDNKVSIEKYFVFSDDIPWCERIFGDDCVYIKAEPFVQLYLMTQMKHIILSNSTFAWWGAYLNTKGGNVIIPDPWFGFNNSHLITDGLYYPSWIRFKHKIVII